ncbi:MAG: hypothetical protein KUG81_09065 [Gammaproteobacteria bacterium]|nr:hypothetical protein [Gammaproteobacteria bacterium]
MGLVEAQCSIPEDYLYFYKIVSSKNCPEKDIKALMWKWTLPEVVVLEEHVDMMDAFETAVSKDLDSKMKG